MDDVVLADFDYAKLDVDGAPIRLRLNSTAVAVANSRTKDGPVDIGYMRSGALHRVQAKQCVLACYNMIIPHIMPELPDAQKRALSLGVKMPLVYANVAIRNWHAFVNLGIDEIYSPYGYFSNVKLDYPVSLGGYRNPRDPSEPMLLHMEHVPLTPNQGLSNVEQFRLGRQVLLDTPFEEFESADRRPARPHAGSRRIPVGARHRGDHRQSLAARLRLRCEFAVRSADGRDHGPARSAASDAAASASPIPMRDGTPTPTRRSIRHGVRSMTLSTPERGRR